MSHVRAAPQHGGYGFDQGRSLLVVSQNQNSPMYLVAGAGLAISVEDETIATFSEGRLIGPVREVALTDWERAQVIRPFTVRGVKPGTTWLNATLEGNNWIQPLEIRVVANPDQRQSADKGAITKELREELQGMSFRDALKRVAEDQMNSAIGRSAKGGNGRYDGAGINWCGSFVYWCYAAVANAKGVVNPFGNHTPENNPLRSGIKALSFGIQNPTKATVIRYEGRDPFAGGPKVQQFNDLDCDNPVVNGDICLPRGDDGGFPHVCMVYGYGPGFGAGSGLFDTIDGNQLGAWRPEGASQTCIGVNSHDATRKIKGKNIYKFAFLHVKVPDE